MARDQRWFELRDWRARAIDRDSWIVLRSQKSEDNGIQGIAPNKEEEHFAAASVTVPVAQRELAARTISWNNLSLMNDHAPFVQEGVYHPADKFETYPDQVRGTHLVLCQRGSCVERSEWHVHPDLVLGLQLKREGDQWLAMDEGYCVVIRLSRDESGSPAQIEIRASHLKDFLAARHEVLCISSYRSREQILAEKPPMPWPEQPTEEGSDGQRWQGSVTTITEHGHQFGSKIAVLHIGRENFDFEQDVPEVGISDQFTTRRFTRKLEGEKLYRVLGELWKVEFVEPGTDSLRVRGDDVPSRIAFYVDAAGTKEAAEALNSKGRWLWFKADVINKALELRGAKLEWYTRETGRVSMGSGGGVPFGVNPLGLVNVYAKDIQNSPRWQQQVWSGFNVIPDGKVSVELLMAQAQGDPADSQAPEAFFRRTMEVLNRNFKDRFGYELIKEHPEHDRLFRIIHRFRSVDESGFYALAKDLARLTADSFDVAALQKVVPLSKGEKRGSLRSLESVLATEVDADKAHIVMTPLFGAYDLRLADAHLPPSELDQAYENVNATKGEPWIEQGARLLDSVVRALTQIAMSFSPK